MNKIEEYIKDNRPEYVVTNRQDKDGIMGLIGLPYPYTIPAKGGTFECLYYWDTYFDNLGLLKSGEAQQAKNNVDNMLYLVHRYGFMPNGSLPVYVSRSQPPYLSEMIKEVYEYYKDPLWLKGAYEMLGKEYNFWMTKRITPTGLNQYNCNLKSEEFAHYAKCYEERVGFRPDGTDEEIAIHAIATSESGWDMNPRCGNDAYNYIQIDLNCLMYMLEKNMQNFAEILENGDALQWEKRAEKRKGLINKYMMDEKGLFFDYNFKENKLGEIYSVASLYPLFAKLASAEQAEAAVANLNRLEEKYGVSTCEMTNPSSTYQWDYPNGWPCMQYVAVKGLLNYGYTKDAMRIANKYIEATEKIFNKTGSLWEKYNVTDGSINVTNEYDMPPMMGWTAGVYLVLKSLK